MKKWLEIIQIIVLIIICIIFLAYLYINKESTVKLNKITEAFQLNTNEMANEDYATKYFDLSANYYTYTDQEIGVKTDDVNVDSVILDIGGSFGEIDINKIPWDSENKELTEGEALWGIVPIETRHFLFRKLYAANQFDSLNSLAFDEDSNAYYFEDPVFHVGTGNEALGGALQFADAVSQLVVPMAFDSVAEHLTKDYIETIIRDLEGEVVSVTRKATTPLIERLSGGSFKNIYNSIGKEFQEAVSSAQKTAIREADGIAKKAGKKVAQKAGVKLSNKVAGKIMAKLMAKAVVKFFRFIIATAVTKVVLLVAAILSGGFLGFLAPLYDFVITPALLILQMPGGILTKAMEKVGPSGGCCPDGFYAVNHIIPPEANMIISFVPIIGDILGLVYDFVCVNKNLSFIPKTKLMLPKYLHYQWLSCYYFEWPNYNCTTGLSTVNGKYWDNSAYAGALKFEADAANALNSIPAALNNIPAALSELTNIVPGLSDIVNNINYSIPLIPAAVKGKLQWTQGPYTNFNDIAKNPDAHLAVSSRVTPKFTTEYNYSFIVPQGTPFFYCDFSDPNILAQMGQLYYDFATRQPYPNDDGTISIQYISKINYVAASSLTTCDVLCDMVNITYDPVKGDRYTEIISKNHDRRFYFETIKTNPAAAYWEDTSDPIWLDIDDKYDHAFDVDDWSLNNMIHDKPFTNTDKDPISAELLLTAYNLKNRSLEALSYASNNIPGLPYDPYAINTLQEFKKQYDNDLDNYKYIINSNLSLPSNADANNGTNYTYTYTSESCYQFVCVNENQQLATTSRIPPLPSGQNWSKTLPSALETLEYQLSTISACKEAYWTHQKSIANVNVNRYKQYNVVGCTHLDATASCALDPDVSQNEEDSRKYVDFDIRPYLKRCSKAAINMRKCIDVSNITTIIESYLHMNPNQRIKTIRHIVPLGQNVCQYTWDEVTIDAANNETNFKKDVINNILYQTDLSSCVFCLPKDGSNVSLYGATVGGQQSATLTAPPTSVIGFTKMNMNSNTNSDNEYYNPNTTLKYNQSFYYKPEYAAGTSNLSGVTLISNVDLIKLFNPSTFEALPDLTRPKKPIRVRYPQDPEKRLGSLSNDICADPRNLQNIIMDYNLANPSNNILKIIRAYTSAANVCDIEVDMTAGITNNIPNVLRKTISIKMKPATESFEDFIPYTYDSINNDQGLNIRQTTTGLASNLSTIGYGYATPFLSNYIGEISPNITYFNDDLIKNYGSNAKQLLKNTNKLLVDLTRSQFLGDGTGNKKCDDPEIQQRIIEQYNIDNYPGTRYNVENNTMLSIVASTTNNSNTCHLVFENEKDTYGDAYSPTTYIQNPDNDYYDSNNYMTVNNLYLKEVKMAQVPGTGTFYPIAGQEYIDISATDLALSTQFDYDSLTQGTWTTPFFTPKRDNCKVPCRGDLMEQALADYQNNTENEIDMLQASMQINYNTCDYLVNNKVYYAQDDGRTLSDILGVLRVTYTQPQYNSSDPACQEFTYTSSNYEMQVPGDVGFDSNAASPLFSYLYDDPLLQSSSNLGLKGFVNNTPINYENIVDDITE